MLIAMEQQSISAQAEILIKEREKHELQRKEMLTMLAIAIRKLGGKLEVDDLVLTTAESLTPTIIGSYCSDMRATIYTIEGEEPK